MPSRVQTTYNPEKQTPLLLSLSKTLGLQDYLGPLALGCFDKSSPWLPVDMPGANQEIRMFLMASHQTELGVKGGSVGVSQGIVGT